MEAIIVMNSPLAAMTDGTATTPGSKYVNLFPNTNATGAYLKVGGVQYPAQNYDFSVTAGYKITHQDLRSFFQRWRNAHEKNNDIFALNVTNQANGLIYCYDFRLDSTETRLLGNGISTRDSGAGIQVSQTYSAGPGQQLMHTFCFYEAQINFSPSGITYIA